MEYFASLKKTIAAALLALAAIAFSLPVFADGASHHYLCSNIANVTVKCSDGKNYSLDCTIPFASQTATYTATSYVGYKFLGWYRPVAALGYYTTSPDFELYTEKVTTNVAFKPADYFLAATCVLHVAGDTPGFTALFMAKYEALEKYSITYNLNGGTNPSSAPTYYYHEIGATLPTPTRTGYTFGGWYVKSDFSGTKQTIISTTDTGAKTYYAKWTANTYAITYTLNSGTNPTGAPTSYTYGVGATLPTPTRTGYTFGGWYTTSTFSGEAQKSISKTDTDAKTYYAKWTVITYTVSFNANGGSGAMDNQILTYDQSVALTANAFSRTGYTFAGWATSSSGSVVHKDKASVKNLRSTSGTYSLYAVWTPITYTVSFNANGGVGAMGNQTLTYDNSVTLTANAFSRTGYTFAGWAASSSGSVIYQDQASVRNLRSTSGTVTLYAKWTANTYTVTYLRNDGSTVTHATRSVVQDGYYNLPSDPSRGGYSFDDWWTDPKSGTAITENTVFTSAANVTLYAHWAPLSYRVTFDGNGSEENPTPREKSVVFGDAYGELPEVSRIGYDFTGWRDPSGNEINETTTFSQQRDITLYAQWIVKRYSIAVKSVNAKITVVESAAYTDRISIGCQDAGKVGYDYAFQGIDIHSGPNSGGKALASFTGDRGAAFRMSTDSTDYYPEIVISATYLETPKTFTVYLEPEEGEIATRQKTVTYDSTYGDLGTPTRAGYTFAGWWTAETGGDEITAETIVKILSNQTLYAHWRYQIAFAKGVDDDSVTGTMTNITAECGKSFTLPTNCYSRVGYRFAEWLSDKTTFADGAEVVSDLPLTDGVAVLTARWEPIKYKISFDANWFTPGTLQTPILTNVVEKSYAIACPLPKWNPVNTLVDEFRGWATSPTGAVIVEDGGTLSEDLSEGEDVTLYAIWRMSNMTLSEAVGCTNLVLKSKSSRSLNISIKEWSRCETNSGIQSGSIEKDKGVDKEDMLLVCSKLTVNLNKQPGRLTFTWKTRTAEDGVCEFYVDEKQIFSASTNETTVVYTNTVADREVVLSWRAYGGLVHNPTPSNLVITSLKWEPFGEHPEPTEDNRPVITSDFSFATSPDFDYVIKCATTLANGGNWTQYGDVITGDGKEVRLPIPPLGDAAGEGASRYGCKFFKVEVIQRGSK